MIPFDLSYYRPETIDEAVSAFQEAKDAGLKPRFFAGGTELVTMARDNKVDARAFVDLKLIPECKGIAVEGDVYRVGACATLNDAVEDGGWQLLVRAGRGVADHTVRNTLTLGGNAAGMLPYREALLPFLVANGSVRIAGPEGNRDVAVREIFDKRLKLGTGEFLVSLSVPRSTTEAAEFYVRHTKDSRVDYPLVTLCMLATEGQTRAAFAGAAAYPVADDQVDAALNDSGSAEERASAAAAVVDKAIRSDMRASAEYRRFLLVDALTSGLKALEG
jgi:CO/xanthine dehydrogenase FAD-binding subunit